MPDVTASVDERVVPEFGEREFQEWVGRILNRWPAVGLAVGVVRDGHLVHFTGHGLADIAGKRQITQDTVFRIASITKTFTAVAVMQLWEKGLVDLDAPANDYLRGYKLVPAAAGHRPATVRQLLTHTAGVPQMVHLARVLESGWFGESFGLDEPLPTLAEYYRGRLRLAVEPGTTFAYSDHGFATLGQIVEDVSREPLDRYFRHGIFEPLGMADTDLLRSEHIHRRLAIGYGLRSGGVRAVTDRQWVTTAASSIYSTPRDMARYLAALLTGSSSEHGTILRPATLAMMVEPHFQPDPRLPGFGLGFFRVDLGGHLAIEHQGVLPGFNSQIFLAPNDGLGVLAFTNGSRQAMSWLPIETEELLGSLIGAPAAVIRTDVAHHPESWRDLCGWYKPRSQRTDMQAWSMTGAGAEVLLRGGRPVLRVLSPIPALYRGFPLHPDDADDPYVYRIDLSQFGLGTARVAFGRDLGGSVTSLNVGLIPFSLEKRPGRENPRRWAGVGVAALAAVSGAWALRRRAAG